MADDDIVRWAKTTTFATPLRWGQIESAVLERPVPAVDEARDRDLVEQARRLRRRAGVISAVGGTVVAAAPAAAIGFVLAGSSESDPGTAVALVGAATQVTLIVAGVGAALPAVVSLESRTRIPLLVALAAWVAVGAAITFALLLGAPDATLRATPLAIVGGTPTVAAATALVATVSTGVAIVRSRGARRTPRVRLEDLTPEQRAQHGLRARVLEVLLGRGLVARRDIDVAAMTEMPLGTWHELDR